MPDKENRKVEYMGINGSSRVCGLLGNPIGHTLSPALHNFLANRLSENLVYVPFLVPAGKEEAAVKGAWALNLLGCNVTVPYKSSVIPWLSALDPLAERIGAVNTLVRTKEGFKGYNTDMPGLYRGMEQEGIRIKGEKVLILGAGGVARAVAVLMAEKGAERILILNRTRERALAISEEINAFTGRDISQAGLLTDYKALMGEGKYLAVQATCVGMYPGIEEAVIEEADFYERIHTGYDLIFNPPLTSFMQRTFMAGGKAYNGAKMLLYQGIIAFELWTGKAVSRELAKEAYQAVFGETKKKDNLVLIGFMGSGKSTVGVRLSYCLRKAFTDTDKLMERREGKSITKIFAEQGEAWFREQETNLLEELAAADGRILSVGGGTPVKPKNRKLLACMGTVVYLRIRPETVYERLKGDTTRPLLKGENPLLTIEELMKQREEIYEEIADITVDVDGMETEDVVQQILEEWEYSGKRTGDG